MSRISVMAAAAVITLSTATAFAQSATPSLGELARRTEQQRAASKPAVKVYTNEDLASDPREVAAAVPAVPAAEAPDTAGYVSKSTGEKLTEAQMLANSQEKIKRDSAKMDEKWWRNQAASLRQGIERAKKMVGEYQTAKPATEAMRQRNARQLADTINGLANLEKRWAAFEESAGYAQVPKEWLEPQ